MARNRKLPGHLAGRISPSVRNAVVMAHRLIEFVADAVMYDARTLRHAKLLLERDLAGAEERCERELFRAALTVLAHYTHGDKAES